MTNENPDFSVPDLIQKERERQEAKYEVPDLEQLFANNARPALEKVSHNELSKVIQAEMPAPIGRLMAGDIGIFDLVKISQYDQIIAVDWNNPSYIPGNIKLHGSGIVPVEDIETPTSEEIREYLARK